MEINIVVIFKGQEVGKSIIIDPIIIDKSKDSKTIVWSCFNDLRDEVIKMISKE